MSTNSHRSEAPPPQPPPPPVRRARVASAARRRRRQAEVDLAAQQDVARAEYDPQRFAGPQTVYEHSGGAQLAPPMSDHARQRLPAQVKWILRQPYMQQGSARWLWTRTFGVTASSAAHCVNAGYVSFRGKTRYTASEKSLLEKARLVSPFDGNSNTRHGHLWEPAALRHLAARHNVDAISVGLLIHPRHRWLGASPDGVLVDGRLVEIKVPFKRTVKSGNPVPIWSVVCARASANHLLQYTH